MEIKKISKRGTSVGFSVGELTFIAAAMNRAIEELDPEEFLTRTMRPPDYDKALLVSIRSAIAQHPPRQASTSARATDDEFLLSLTGYELHAMGDAMNESVNGLRGSDAFLKAAEMSYEVAVELVRKLAKASQKVPS